MTLQTPIEIKKSIRYKYEWFNPIYFHIKKYLADKNIRRILTYGGSSAAKSHSILQALGTDGYRFSYSSLIFRKEQASIKDTVKNELLAALENARIHNAYSTYEFELRGNKGNKIRLRGLDKEGKVKGLKGYKKLYFDELDHFTYKDWSEAGRRLRGEDNQQIIASWNPVSETHWIKTDYIDKIEWKDLPTKIEGNPYSGLDVNSFVKISEDGRTILIKTTYLDNKWIVGGEVNGKKYGRVDQQVIDEFEQMKRLNASDYNIYGLGNWGIISNDNPFFYSFNPQKHNKLYEYIINPNFLLDISFDFNVNPTTALIGQYDTHNNSAHIFDLITANYDTIKGVSPLEACCQLIYNKYIITGLVQPYRLRITGDASGKSGSADKIKSINFYSTISKSLKIRESQIFIRKINLQHQVSSSICNYVFRVIRENHFNIHYLSELINDINLSFKDDKGTLNEAKAKNGLHYVDAMRYLIDFWYSNKFDTNVDRITNYIDGIAKRIK